MILPAACCCGDTACCHPWEFGWSCGSKFGMSVDWRDVYYERATDSPCREKYPTMDTCNETDCDLCAQEQDVPPAYDGEHCRYWSLTDPKVGVMDFQFTICANSSGVSASPYHMSIGRGLDYLCECANELPCDCNVKATDVCCSNYSSITGVEFCVSHCVDTPGRYNQATNNITKLLDGRGGYTDDSLVITSTSGAITAFVRLCNRNVSPTDAATYPDNKDYFDGLPSNLSSCAYVQRRDLTILCTHLDWVHINVTRGENSYNYYCYGTANHYAEWANANIPNIVVTGSDFWFGLRLPASSISTELDVDGGCVYAPIMYCEHAQSDYKLNPITLGPLFMPDNSDDWILQSTSGTVIKWKCRAAYWYNNTLTVAATNSIGGSNQLSTITCGANTPYCTGCYSCGTTWTLAGTCAGGGSECDGLSMPDSVSQCGLHGCLDINGTDTCDPVVGCCNGFVCATGNPCLAGPKGTLGAVWVASSYIASLYGTSLEKWTGWTLFSDSIRTFNPNGFGYCKPVSIQGGSDPT